MASIIDRPPSRLLAALFRAPRVLYRWHLGRLLGNRVLLLRHVGRKTGRERTAVLEVVWHDRRRPAWYVAAAWGEQADWFRNLRAHPDAVVEVAGRCHAVRARVLEPQEASAVYAEYVSEHPWAARMITRVIGFDLERAAGEGAATDVPLVELASTGGPPTP